MVSVFSGTEEPGKNAERQGRPGRIGNAQEDR